MSRSPDRSIDGPLGGSRSWSRRNAAGRRGFVGGGCRGFTLIELMMVIGIIALLAGLGLAFGFRMSGAGRQSVTLSAIKVLEESLADYKAAKDRIPPAVYKDPDDPTGQRYVVVADARNMSFDDTIATRPGFQIINSVGRYIKQLNDVPTAAKIMESLDAKIIRPFDPDSSDPRPDPAAPGRPIRSESQERLLTVFDGWGHPIRYVNPTFHGVLYGPDLSSPGTPAASFIVGSPLSVPSPLPSGGFFNPRDMRRNNVHATTPTGKAQDDADSDGGTCQGGRPYFYSAGPDGKVGVLKDATTGKVLEDYNTDNVYLVRPQFPKN